MADGVNSFFDIRADHYEHEASWISDMKFISPLVPTVFGTQRLLDACCGTGIVAEHCMKVGWKVLAVDISQDMLAHVDPSVESLLADIQHLPLADKSFDVTVCRQGLQYLDLVEGLNSLIRVTKSEIRLGHITILDKCDFDFWKDYFSASAPCRKTVFFPGQIGELASKLGLTLVDEQIIISPDSLTGPIQHLDNQARNALYSRIINSSERFKERNGIRVTDDGQLISNRRWEFMTYRVPDAVA